MNRNINAGSSPETPAKEKDEYYHFKVPFHSYVTRWCIIMSAGVPIIQGGYQRTKKHPAGNGYECSAG